MSSTTFYQLWNRVTADTYLDLPAGAAKNYVQETWREIQNARPWGFLLAESVMVAPAVITGNITFTYGSTTATPDATLKAILDALATEPPLTRRSIRVPLSSIASFVSSRSLFYDIYAYDQVPASNNITLNRRYQEASGTQTVQIYRRYFLPPYDYAGLETSDFLRFVAVRDLDNNKLLGMNLSYRQLEARDPRREATGIPQIIVSAPATQPNYPGVSWESTSPLIPGVPLYEIWPHYVASTQKVYSVLYQRYGTDFTDDFGAVTSVLPPYITEEYILSGARMKAYRWAESNKGRIPSLQKTNWFKLYEMARTEFNEHFLEARRIDEEATKQDFIPNWGSLTGAFGADYAQTHDLNAWQVFYGGGGF